MTRINLVNPDELSTKHLVAEYRELPRVFNLAVRWFRMSGKIEELPKSYCMGKGHVRFFYDKLAFLSNRQTSILAEMKRRGFSPKFTKLDFVNDLPSSLMNDWKPDANEISISRTRILERQNAALLRAESRK